MQRYEIEQTLRDYHWMIREIERLRELLGDAGEKVVRAYEGMDMPKPQGSRTDPVALEVSRRERHWKKLYSYEQKVMFVQERIDIIHDERERTVLDCMLDGMTIVSIANHMGCSRKTVRAVRESIVEKFLSKEKTPA